MRDLTDIESCAVAGGWVEELPLFTVPGPTTPPVTPPPPLSPMPGPNAAPSPYAPYQGGGLL